MRALADKLLAFVVVSGITAYALLAIGALFLSGWIEEQLR